MNVWSMSSTPCGLYNSNMWILFTFFFLGIVYYQYWHTVYEYNKEETCWRWFTLPIQDQANILHGIRGRWTMRSEIMNALLLREVANLRTIMQKWIGYEEEALWSQEVGKHGTWSKVMHCETMWHQHWIWKFDYSHKWIVDPDPIKVQPEWHIFTHENTWLRKVNWDPLQWTWRDPFVFCGTRKVIPFFQFTTRLGDHIIATQTTWESIWCKDMTHISCSPMIQLSLSFGRKSGNNNMLGELPRFNGY